MKKLITLILIMSFCSAGCYASQRDALNSSFKEQSAVLDYQCKNNMTEWCAMQYATLHARHEQDLRSDDAATENGVRRGVIVTILIVGLGAIAAVVYGSK